MKTSEKLKAELKQIFDDDCWSEDTNNCWQSWKRFAKKKGLPYPADFPQEATVYLYEQIEKEKIKFKRDEPVRDQFLKIIKGRNFLSQVKKIHQKGLARLPKPKPTERRQAVAKLSEAFQNLHRFLHEEKWKRETLAEHLQKPVADVAEREMMMEAHIQAIHQCITVSQYRSINSTDQLGHAISTEPTLVNCELSQLKKIVDDLPVPLQALIKLRYWHGLSYKQIAAWFRKFSKGPVSAKFWREDSLLDDNAPDFEKPFFDSAVPGLPESDLALLRQKMKRTRTEIGEKLRPNKKKSS